MNRPGNSIPPSRSHQKESTPSQKGPLAVGSTSDSFKKTNRGPIGYSDTGYSDNPATVTVFGSDNRQEVFD